MALNFADQYLLEIIQKLHPGLVQNFNREKKQDLDKNFTMFIDSIHLDLQYKVGIQTM